MTNWKVREGMVQMLASGDGGMTSNEQFMGGLFKICMFGGVGR